MQTDRPPPFGGGGRSVTASWFHLLRGAASCAMGEIGGVPARRRGIGNDCNGGTRMRGSMPRGGGAARHESEKSRRRSVPGRCMRRTSFRSPRRTPRASRRPRAAGAAWRRRVPRARRARRARRRAAARRHSARRTLEVPCRRRRPVRHPAARRRRRARCRRRSGGAARHAAAPDDRRRMRRRRRRCRAADRRRRRVARRFVAHHRLRDGRARRRAARRTPRRTRLRRRSAPSFPRRTPQERRNRAIPMGAVGSPLNRASWGGAGAPGAPGGAAPDRSRPHPPPRAGMGARRPAPDHCAAASGAAAPSAH